MRRIALAAAALAGLSYRGCMTVAPLADTAQGASGFSYSAGRAWQDFGVPPTALNGAITGAMDDLRMHGVTQSQDGTAWFYQGLTADDRRVIVTIRPNRGTSRISARIGWFGDEPLSRALMDRVGIRIGTLPPSAVPVDPPSAPESNPFFSRDAVPDSTMLREQADAVYHDSPVPRP